MSQPYPPQQQQGYPPPQQGYPPPQQTTVIVQQGKAYNTSTNLPPKVLATLAVIFQWLGSIIIIFVEYQNAFAIAWAYQSLMSAILFWICWIIFQIVESSCLSNIYNFNYTTGSYYNSSAYNCWNAMTYLVAAVWLAYLVYIISLFILIWTRGDREEFYAMPGIGPIAWRRAVRRVQAYGLPVTGSCSSGCGGGGAGAGAQMAPGAAVVTPAAGTTTVYTKSTPV